MRRLVLWTIGITALVGCVAAANFRRDHNLVEVDWQLFRPSPPAVVVGHPDRGPIARTIAAKGVVEPVHQSQVVAKVSGKVREVRVEEGSSVRKGDVLFKLDDASFRTRADSAKTRLDTARTNLDKAEAHLRDIEKDPAAATATSNVAAPLANFPGITAPTSTTLSKLEAARNSVDGWKRERKSAESADESARSDLDRTLIRATIDGIVEDLAVEIGDDVASSPTTSLNANAMPNAPGGLMGAGMGFAIDAGTPRPDPSAAMGRPLCLILDPDELRVRAWIDEADVSLVVADQPAKIFLPDEPSVPVSGRISKVAARGRPNGEVVAYAATLIFDDARRRPKAGMRVNVEVEVSRKESLLGVPVQAVLHRKRRDLVRASASRSDTATGDREVDSGYVKAVFVVDGNLVRLRPIETGLSDEKRVEVVSGLSSNDRIVVGPFRALDTLEDGMLVRSESEPEDALSLTQGPIPSRRRPTR